MVQASHNRPVLLIDDSHEDLFLLKRLLSRGGVVDPIVTVDGGEEAVVFLRACMLPGAEPLLPFLIFCDVKMPAQDGFEVLQWIRSQKLLANVPVYVLSGADLEEDRVRAAALGANGYLAKFPTPAMLLEIVERSAKVRRSAVTDG